MSESNANMAIWSAAEKTDPKYTKSFSRAGGFSGTAINATYLIRKATEMWGPLGREWGYTIEDEKYVPGGEEYIIHVLRIRFRYPGGEFPAYGQTTFVGINKNGVFTDEEAPKKSLTDAITKALSMLGFAADVHMGMYDDNKYVNSLKAEFGVQPVKSVRITPTEEAYLALTEEEKATAKKIGNSIIDLWNEDKKFAAYEAFYEANLSLEMQAGVWHILGPHSKMRSELKAMKDSSKERKAA